MTENIGKKIDELVDFLNANPAEFKRLTTDRDGLLAERGLGPDVVAKFEIRKVDDVGAKGGCKCSSWCGFGCFYGEKIGAEGETCVG